MEDMFREAFDLEDDDAHYIATWMTSNHQIHQIAVLEGPQAELHHFAFELQDRTEIGRAGDLFSMDDLPIDIGPTRHGITRGQTIYFFDPAGNRNEVFSGLPVLPGPPDQHVDPRPDRQRHLPPRP